MTTPEPDETGQADDVRTEPARGRGPAPSHYSAQTKARFVETRKVHAVRRHLALSLRVRQPVLIWGDVGLGKTSAVRWTLGQLVGGEFAEITFAQNPNRRENIAAVHDALRGFPGVGTAASIERATKRWICDHPFVLVVDEIETIALDRLAMLRTLMDHPGSQLVLVLIGSKEARGRITADPRFMSRLLTDVAFSPMGKEATYPAMREYHPAYREMPRTTLREIYELRTRGEWRAIAKFTACLEWAAEELGDDIANVAESTLSAASRYFAGGAT